ncbi:hypothetical protein EGW08_013604 [Elysia chlorotica]|uniref:Uncharacterized protein n=1 Tax=Elysia chlorotica TaxID=188477 RepID=A0A3S1B9Y5_ELYCH|nr:hypothetical protein EGW08_013604 [Elysia chlorotica]
MNVRKEFISLKKVKVICPDGFPYHAYDAKGQVTPWSIIRMVDFSRNIAFSNSPTADPPQQSFLDVVRLTEEFLLFTAATSTSISPNLYDSGTKKGPLELHLELDNVGNTSYCIKTLFFLGDQDRPVIENETQMVMVDFNLKRPSPPPDWWREKYSAGGLETGKGLRLPRAVPPESGVLSHYQVKIAASDLDIYLHTNWANYLKFCYDAFVDYKFHQVHQVHQHGRESIQDAFRKTRRFALRFMHETSLGDALDVTLWKDSGNPDLYMFQVLKQAEDLCEAQVEFYPDEDDDDEVAPKN